MDPNTSVLDERVATEEIEATEETEAIERIERVERAETTEAIETVIERVTEETTRASLDNLRRTRTWSSESSLVRSECERRREETKRTSRKEGDSVVDRLINTVEQWSTGSLLLH